MLSQSYITVLAILLSPLLTNASPQLTDATSPNPTVFYAWSDDPTCTSKACISDCKAAVTEICNTADFGTMQNATVGDCTAFYWYDIGNNVPTKDSCLSAYNYIINAAKPGPGACGGTIGGALGYDKLGNRTHDPLFAVYPRDGNANCFKAPGDTSPVKGKNELPNGGTLDLDSCPDATSRRRRSVVQSLEKRSLPPCLIENLEWQLGCNVVCLSWVGGSLWWSGPFIAAGALACLGGCDAVSWKLLRNCEHKAANPKLKERATAPVSKNPCENIMRFGFECPAWQHGLLSAYSCPGSSADEAGSNVGGGSGGVINAG
ncbi:MAG: hypothetical protein Q9170_005054 [Blastenia crenularia]